MKNWCGTADLDSVWVWATLIDPIRTWPLSICRIGISHLSKRPLMVSPSPSLTRVQPTSDYIGLRLGLMVLPARGGPLSSILEFEGHLGGPSQSLRVFSHWNREFEGHLGGPSQSLRVFSHWNRMETRGKSFEDFGLMSLFKRIGLLFIYYHSKPFSKIINSFLNSFI